MSMFSVICFCLLGLTAAQTVVRSTAPADRSLIWAVTEWSVPVIDVHRNDVSRWTRRAFIDTGAGFSVVARSVLENESLTHLMVPSPVTIRTNWGSIEQFAKLDLLIPNSRMPDGEAVVGQTTQEFAVMNDSTIPSKW